MGQRQIARDDSVGAPGELHPLDLVATAVHRFERRRHGDPSRSARVDQRAVDVEQKNFHQGDCTKDASGAGSADRTTRRSYPGERGKNTLNVVPMPGWETTSRRPPWSCTMP